MPLLIRLTDAPASKIYPTIDFTAHRLHSVDGQSVKLINAIKKKDIQKIRDVIHRVKTENPEAFNNENDKQETPLSVAISENNVEVCQLLIENGCDVNKDGKVPPFYLRLCPLSQAVVQNNIELVQLLVKSKCQKDQMDTFGRAAISYAVSAGHLDIVKYLLHVGCSANTRPDTGYSLLHEACSKGIPAIVKVLLDSGADTDIFEVKDRTTPAFFTNQIQIHDLLIQYGSDVNFVSRSGDTVLHNAIISGNQNLVEFLLEKGALLTSKRMKCLYTANNHLNNISYQDPLDLAAEQQHFNICQTLIKHGSELLPVCACPENYNVWHRMLGSNNKPLIKAILTDFLPLPNYSDCVMSFTKLYQDEKDLLKWVEEFMDTPRELKDICRSVIRMQVRLSSNGRSIVGRIQQLPVPESIKQFLIKCPNVDV